MKVILLKELQGRGGEGDVINVARGFANNYLLPQGIAVLATKGNLKQLEERKANIEKREETRLEEANALAEKLNDLKVHVKAQVGEEGQLFGSVTSVMIAEAIKEEHDIEVDKRRVELGKPIKVVGEYKVSINIYRNIGGTVTVVVAGEDAPIEEEEQVVDETPSEEVELNVEEVAPESDVEQEDASDEAVDEQVD
jgi:large subunit ribosomal protein L9